MRSEAGEKIGTWERIERATYVLAILSWLGIGSGAVLWKYLQWSPTTLLIMSLVALVAVGARLWVVQRDFATAKGALTRIRDRNNAWPPDEVLHVTQLVGDADFVNIRAEGVASVLVGIRLVNKSPFEVHVTFMDLAWEIVAGPNLVLARGTYSKAPPIDPMPPGQLVELTDLGAQRTSLQAELPERRTDAVLWLRGLIHIKYGRSSYRQSFNEGIVVAIRDHRPLKS